MRKFRNILILSLLAVLAFPVMAFAQEGGSIVYDQTVTGELSDDNYEIDYQFEGRAGELILIAMNATSENPRLDSYLYLRDADGQEIAFDDDGGGNLNSLIGPISLPADGTYTVVATRFQQASGNSEGTFELTVRLAQINPIFLNETITLELDGGSNNVRYFGYTASEAGLYDFTVANIIGVGGVNVMVEAEDGMFLNSFYVTNEYPSIPNPTLLTAGQTVNIALRYEPSYAGDAPATSGSLRFDLTLSMVDTSPISFDTAVTGTLDDNNNVDYYSFDGNAGDIIRLYATRTTGEFEVTLLDPRGMPFNGSATPYMNGEIVLDPVVLSATGSHTIIIRRTSEDGPFNLNGMITDYTMTLSVTATPFLDDGVEYTGTVGESDMEYEEVLRFEGEEGQTVRITLRSVDENYAPSLDIQSSQIDTANAPMPEMGFGGGMGMPGDFYVNFGSSEVGTMSYEVTLPFSGIYLVRVRNGAYGEMGPIQGQFGVLVETIN